METRQGWVPRFSRIENSNPGNLSRRKRERERCMGEEKRREGNEGKKEGNMEKWKPLNPGFVNSGFQLYMGSI